MKKPLILCLLCLPIFLKAQQNSEETAVIQTIKALFEGMRAGDSTAMRSLFDPSARLQTTFVNKEGQPILHTDDIEKWLESVATPHKEIYDEQIFSYRTEIDGRLATVWTDYTFYVGDQLSHCGVNAFQLFHSDEAWKIIQVTDTRRRSDCQEDSRRQINALMDAWHKAAAEADEAIFFGSMTADAIYLGTEAGERWLRDELKKWSEKYFARESAWSFSSSSRVIYFSPDKNTAWFEEDLATGMGPCRGSGVLANTEEGWKIKHYNLAVTVPNDKIEEFKELMEAE